jgi:hypothetical protein
MKACQVPVTGPPPEANSAPQARRKAAAPPRPLTGSGSSQDSCLIEPWDLETIEICLKVQDSCLVSIRFQVNLYPTLDNPSGPPEVRMTDWAGPPPSRSPEL